MPRDVDEKALFDRFSSKYEVIKSDLLQAIERSNCGCDYGATSFATREQVDDLGAMLALGPGKRLLEVGAGAGWPGLYLAKKTGCDVTLTDLPIEGLRVARQRAVSDNLNEVSRVAVASGSALPFRQGWFDAISHSDVLCCLVDKRAVLRACREVINAAGEMVFSVILTSPGLSAADYQRALEGGPSFMSSDASYPDLLHQSGWELIDQVNLSSEFMDTLQCKLGNELDHAVELEKLLGKEETAIRLSRTRSYIDALEHGLIRREFFHAIPASRG